MTKYRIYQTEIHCSHYIKNHPTCGERHGHSYRIKISVEAKEDFYDFYELRKDVDSILSAYDHQDIGNKTCEKLIEEITEALMILFPNRKLKVEIFETSKFGVSIEV